MKSITILLVAFAACTLSATGCAADKGKLTKESRAAFEQMRREKITSPDMLFTNADVNANFVYTICTDSVVRTVKGTFSIGSRVFNYYHTYVNEPFGYMPVITTDCDTTGLSQEILTRVRICLMSMDSYAMIRSKHRLKISDAQMTYLGTNGAESEYEVRWVVPEINDAASYRYVCDLAGGNVTEAALKIVRGDGRITTEVVRLRPYPRIGRCSYSDDDCYLKYAESAVYKEEKNGKLLFELSISDMHFSRAALLPKR